jgi:DNA-binding MarR family transcriptional regulator
MYNTTAQRALWEEPCLAARIRRVHRVVGRVYDAALRDEDLTAAQLDVLMTLLASEEGMRRIDLARALEAERSTVTRNLDRMEARGLVTAVPGATRHEALVEVTPAGRRAAEAAADAWYAAQRTIRDRLGADGVAALELVSGRLTDAGETPTPRSNG